ncbi:MAG: hypothetical protein ACREOE_14370 [Gemmatimonadales bacterium]
MTRRNNQTSPVPITPRTRAQVSRFFTGLDMIPPGVGHRQDPHRAGLRPGPGPEAEAVVSITANEVRLWREVPAPRGG